MTEHEKVFFSILRSALWGTPVEMPEGFTQWGAIMKLAKTQALMGLVGDVLLTNSTIRANLPEKFVAKLQDVPMTSVGMHSQMNIALQLLVTTLRSHGVEPVLLKGQGLARNYPIPELRQCGDIDIYVGAEKCEQAYEAMLPIVSEIDDKSQIWSWMHFHASIGSVMIEVHHKADRMSSSRADELYQTYIQKGLSEDLCPVRFGEMDVMTPNDNFNAFYIFHHLWRHFISSGVGLRQFCDWACFLHTHVGKLDLPFLKKMIEDLGFMKPWQVFGCFLVQDLGLPKEEFPFYNEKYVGKVERVREYVMNDGNFGMNTGYARVRKHSYLREKLMSLKFHASRFFRMFLIFPKHTMLRLWYMFRDGFSQIFKDLRKLLCEL